MKYPVSEKGKSGFFNDGPQWVHYFPYLYPSKCAVCSISSGTTNKYGVNSFKVWKDFCSYLHVTDYLNKR
jgi:hypothetical protein